MQFTDSILAIFIAIIILFGLTKKVKIFDAFLLGAQGGFDTAISILPSIIGLVTAVSMLRASGAIDLLSSMLRPITESLGFPTEVLPLALLRPVSGGASTAILNDILNTYGPDSFAGKVASVICGSTETTFYTLTVYFAAVHAKNTRHTLKSALLADFTGIALGTMLVHLLL